MAKYTPVGDGRGGPGGRKGATESSELVGAVGRGTPCLPALSLRVFRSLLSSQMAKEISSSRDWVSYCAANLFLTLSASPLRKTC